MQVQKESWILPDGTHVHKICHTIGRCRKTTFPFNLNSVVVADIIEIRCNVEVHEQIQENQDLSMVSDCDETEDGNYQTSPDHNSEVVDIDAVSNASVRLSSDIDSEYHFNRFSGNHVEVHYNHVVDENEKGNFCKLAPILSYLIPEDRSVCSADVTVVYNSR